MNSHFTAFSTEIDEGSAHVDADRISSEMPLDLE